MNSYSNFRGASLRAAARRAVLGAVGIVALTACSDLLEVNDPEFATPETVADSAAIPNLYAGAIGDFNGAYSGEGLDDEFLSVTALITDEFRVADTFPTRNATDKRAQLPIAQGNTSDDAYVNLHQARRSAKDAAAVIENFIGTDDERWGLLKSLEGYTYVALAEGFCSGIPFSESEGSEFTYGQPMSTAEVFSAAVTIFDAALAADPSNFLAMVGKGRALVNQGQFAAAATAVAGVKTTDVYQIQHSETSGRLQNPIWNLNISNGRYTQTDVEGENGMPYRSSLDPRTPWADIGVGFDGNTPLYAVLRYPVMSTDVPLASGVEARLIEAEAALAANDVPGFLLKLNNLRDSVDILMPILFEDYELGLSEADDAPVALAPLTDPGTAQGRVDMLFRERAFWLYATGHRLGDMRRMIRPTAAGGYGMLEDDVFPTGDFAKGGEYGDDVNLPIPFDEQNNPNWDVSMCNTKAP